MKITVEDLERLGACKEGIEIFRDIFGDEYVAEWTLEEQINLIRSPLRKYFGWAVNMSLVPMWSMSEANLSGANLSEAIGLEKKYD